jgi:hypothetical protein
MAQKGVHKMRNLAVEYLSITDPESIRKHRRIMDYADCFLGGIQ